MQGAAPFFVFEEKHRLPVIGNEQREDEPGLRPEVLTITDLDHYSPARASLKKHEARVIVVRLNRLRLFGLRTNRPILRACRDLGVRARLLKAQGGRHRPLF